MPEEKGRKWERKNLRPASAPKQKQRFIQKYYHKGAFFQDDLHNTTTLLVVMEFSTVIFVLQLVRTRSIKLFYPNLCKSSILVEVEEQNGLILLMKIQLTGIIRMFSLSFQQLTSFCIYYSCCACLILQMLFC